MERHTETDIEETRISKYTTVGKMKPGQFGVTGGGEFVMRTLSTDKHEVMSLSDPHADNCWTSGTSAAQVELLDELTVTFRRIE